MRNRIPILLTLVIATTVMIFNFNTKCDASVSTATITDHNNDITTDTTGTRQRLLDRAKNPAGLPIPIDHHRSNVTGLCRDDAEQSIELAGICHGPNCPCPAVQQRMKRRQRHSSSSSAFTAGPGSVYHEVHVFPLFHRRTIIQN